MSTLADQLLALDSELVRAGFPPLSPWWRSTLVRFLRSGRRRLVLRVGRRGGKSSSVSRLVVLLALFGEWKIPPGDVGVVAFVSVSRDEASQRLRTIRSILNALKVGHRPIENGVELTDRSIAFKVFAATVASVSGPTCIAIVGDELAKWRDADSGANPATEVLAALRPTTATQKNAVEVLCSSPLSNEDAHAKAFDEGDNARQLTAAAPTWLANPTITEAETRDLEKDERVWRREYLAVPQASALACFDEDAIERAFRPQPIFVKHCRRVAVVDPSSGRSDTWAWGFAGWSYPAGAVDAPMMLFDRIAGIEGSFWK